MPDKPAQRPWAKDLAEAREVAARLSASLPSQIEVAALGVRSKAPYQLLATREALIWRTEELARNACEAIEKEDFAVAALLTRAVAESAAMTWYLMKVLADRAGYTPGQLNDKLMQLLVGKKRKKDKDKKAEPDTDDIPEAINVGTFVKHVDRKLPGFEAAYDFLSEYAHPNWLGVSGLYSKHDADKFRTEFGRGLHGERDGSRLAHALAAGLSTFEIAYNKIADDLPAFLAELEKF
jgi:hypothetical protein